MVFIHFYKKKFLLNKSSLAFFSLDIIFTNYAQTNKKKHNKAQAIKKKFVNSKKNIIFANPNQT
jgi:hypothetical protein